MVINFVECLAEGTRRYLRWFFFFFFFGCLLDIGFVIGVAVNEFSCVCFILRVLLNILAVIGVMVDGFSV
jgi:hypothetical protein